MVKTVKIAALITSRGRVGRVYRGPAQPLQRTGILERPVAIRIMFDDALREYDGDHQSG